MLIITYVISSRQKQPRSAVMSEFFWESIRKARREHFCDLCHHWIQPGETYTRTTWAPRGMRSFHVLKEHYLPHCPPNEGEEEKSLKTSFEEYATPGVPIVIVTEVRQVLKIGVNGQTITESELHFTSKLLPTTTPTQYININTEDAPF